MNGFEVTILTILHKNMFLFSVKLSYFQMHGSVDSSGYPNRMTIFSLVMVRINL